MSHKLRNLVPLMLLVMLVTVNGLAQQQISGSVSQPRRASLTTEDVEARNPSAVLKTTRAVPRDQQQTDAFTAAEIAWNARYRAALARVRELERRADQAELAAARARNAYFDLNQPRDPQQKNQLNAAYSDQTALSKQLRAEAERAFVELNALLEEARREGFMLRTFALFKSNGQPDPESFRERLLELRQDLRDAEARAAVMDLRARRAQTNLRVNACAGVTDINIGRFNCSDIYYVNRQRAELQTTQEELTAAQARIEAVKKQIAELIEQGLDAGLPPGLFR